MERISGILLFWMVTLSISCKSGASDYGCNYHINRPLYFGSDWSNLNQNSDTNNNCNNINKSFLDYRGGEIGSLRGMHKVDSSNDSDPSIEMKILSGSEKMAMSGQDNGNKILRNIPADKKAKVNNYIHKNRNMVKKKKKSNTKMTKVTTSRNKRKPVGLHLKSMLRFFIISMFDPTCKGHIKYSNLRKHQKKGKKSNER